MLILEITREVRTEELKPQESIPQKYYSYMEQLDHNYPMSQIEYIDARIQGDLLRESDRIETREHDPRGWEVNDRDLLDYCKKNEIRTWLLGANGQVTELR